MSRNPQLSVHQPQSLSVARATSANKEIIFGKLGSLYAKLNIISKPIFNVDETGITVVTKPKGTSGTKSCLFPSCC